MPDVPDERPPMLGYENPRDAARERAERGPWVSIGPMELLPRRLAVLGTVFAFGGWVGIQSIFLWYYGLLILLAAMLVGLAVIDDKVRYPHSGPIDPHRKRLRPLLEVSLIAFLMVAMLFNVSRCPHARYLHIGPHLITIEGSACRNNQGSAPWWLMLIVGRR